MKDIKYTFKIREIKQTRRTRGVEWIRVDVFEDNEYSEWLWMNEHHIKLNKLACGQDCFLNKLEDFL